MTSREVETTAHPLDAGIVRAVTLRSGQQVGVVDFVPQQDHRFAAGVDVLQDPRLAMQVLPGEEGGVAEQGENGQAVVVRVPGVRPGVASTGRGRRWVVG